MLHLPANELLLFTGGVVILTVNRRRNLAGSNVVALGLGSVYELALVIHVVRDRQLADVERAGLLNSLVDLD